LRPVHPEPAHERVGFEWLADNSETPTLEENYRNLGVVTSVLYALAEGALVFGSEIKAMACHPAIQLRMDPVSLAQVFTYWSTLTPKSVFQGIKAIPPGGYLLARDGRVSLEEYWELRSAAADKTSAGPPDADAEGEFDEELGELLVDAVRIRLRAAKENYLLRKLGQEWLPRDTAQRPKRPYWAPIHRCFSRGIAPDYVQDLLSPNSLKASGLFHPTAVGQLLQNLESRSSLGETEDMAVAGIVSSQLVHQQFVASLHKADPLSAPDSVKVCRQQALRTAAC
jgi:asparagine synthetase B (glutamine-hydrolysing)